MNDPVNPYAPPQTDHLSSVPQADALDPVLAGVVYPLKFTFKILAFAPQINVTDANGRSVLYARQKLFKFREHVEIFTDSTRTTKLAEIRANKVIDWSARYFFTDAWGGAIGSVGRRGWRSLWRAHYEAFNPGDDRPDFAIREENPFAKVMDGMLGSIPFLDIITGFFFHPKYLATRTDGSQAMRLTKRAAFLQGKFSIEKLGELSARETMNLILSFMMLALLERRRG
jgi:hypothetical protein